MAGRGRSGPRLWAVFSGSCRNTCDSATVPVKNVVELYATPPSSTLPQRVLASTKQPLQRRRAGIFLQAFLIGYLMTTTSEAVILKGGVSASLVAW
jgi:hypothetical protein